MPGTHKALAGDCKRSYVNVRPNKSARHALNYFTSLSPYTLLCKSMWWVS